ncbi:hypothetical protein [Flavobacterium haoranii]|uniref:Lipoprotein n=1 Tax=Flavobacterium haoranii TaxID=683124 RepID=A0A1M6K0Z1_9FLAO|nr:hypothetical protein [Flavobacterium haoranii]SHJ52641.1 hypothetical protein SAMN05444337_2156 [Flavobacterium haoranii]
MKKLTFLFLILFSISFSSCSSDNDSDSSNNGNNQLYVRFTVSGINYDLNPTTISSLQRLIMAEQNTNNAYKRISLWMPINPVNGSHTITDDFPTDNNLETLYNADFWIDDMIYTATSGIFEVTEFDEEYIKGSFSFVGEDENGDTIEITNGTFRAYR